MGWILSGKTCRYLFQLAALGMQITAPNWENQIAPWRTGLPGKHANRLSAAHPRAIGGVCTSACVPAAGFRAFVSVVLSFASSISMHRQGIVNGSSGVLGHGYFRPTLVLFFGPPLGLPLLGISEGTGMLVGLPAGGTVAHLCTIVPVALVKERVYRMGEG